MNDDALREKFKMINELPSLLDAGIEEFVFGREV